MRKQVQFYGLFVFLASTHVLAAINEPVGTMVKKYMKNSIFVGVQSGGYIYFSEDGKIKFDVGRNKFMTYDYKVVITNTRHGHFDGYFLVEYGKKSVADENKLFFFGKLAGNNLETIESLQIDTMIRITENDLYRLKKGEISIDQLM